MRRLFAGTVVLLGVGLISLDMYLTAFWKFTSDASFGFGRISRHCGRVCLDCGNRVRKERR